MPKSLYDPLDWADKTADIIEQTQDHVVSQSPSGRTVEDCYNDVGGAHGFADGFAVVDFGINGIAGPIAAPSPWDAAPICDPLDVPFPDSPISIPSFTNPIWAGLEVALTPTTVADATPRPTDADHSAYMSGYNESYNAGALAAFDSNLDARFEPSPQAPDPFPEPAITNPVAALDYVPPSPCSSSDAGWHLPTYQDTSYHSTSSGFDGGSSSYDGSSYGPSDVTP